MKEIKYVEDPRKPTYTAKVYEHGTCVLTIHNFQLGGSPDMKRQHHPEWFVGMIHGCTDIPYYGIFSAFFPYLKKSVFLEISEYNESKKEFTLVVPSSTKIDYCIDPETKHLRV